jgi:hypothetical protein
MQPSMRAAWNFNIVGLNDKNIINANENGG